MIDEYEIRLQQKHRMFSGVQEKMELERRGIQRRDESSTRRRLLERRQNTDVHVEIERRKAQRRSLNERRSFEERRVTSDYSQERLEEERQRLKPKKTMESLFKFFTTLFFCLVGVLIYWIFKQVL